MRLLRIAVSFSSFRAKSRNRIITNRLCIFRNPSGFCDSSTSLGMTENFTQT